MSQTSPYLRDVERFTTDRPISCKLSRTRPPRRDVSVAPLSLTQFVAVTRRQSHHHIDHLHPAHTRSSARRCEPVARLELKPDNQRHIDEWPRPR
ncbi:hypothetical protein B0H12DRAFT_755805 [Mycena haematopus]|nr:hypothetical protein B0H12DRAFT_755805 [Mycena haematopus]